MELRFVIPAKAEIQDTLRLMDSRLRGNDGCSEHPQT